MDKKKMYIILIAVAAVVLTALIIWAISIKLNRSADVTDPTGGLAGTTTQSADDTTGESTTLPEDSTAEETTGPEDTTGDATDATDETSDGNSGSSGGNSGSSGGNSGSSGGNSGSSGGNSGSSGGNSGSSGGNSGNSGGNTDSSGSTKPTEPPLPDEYPYTLTYKEYMAMSEDEQIAFYKQFKNHSEFKRWHTAAKKEYEENKIELEIGPDGKIDLGQLKP